MGEKDEIRVVHIVHLISELPEQSIRIEVVHNRTSSSWLRTATAHHLPN